MSTTTRPSSNRCEFLAFEISQQFQYLYEVHVPENQLPTEPLLVINASDADSGENAQFSCSLTVGDRDFFGLNPTTGELVLRQALDREAVAVHRLEVECTDEGNPPLTEKAVVKVIVEDVNDNSPRFETLLHAEMPEDTLPGAVVTRVKARDLDESSTGLRFAFADYEQPDSFRINETSGEITLLKPIDREVTQEVKLKVGGITLKMCAEVSNVSHDH